MHWLLTLVDRHIAYSQVNQTIQAEYNTESPETNTTIITCNPIGKRTDFTSTDKDRDRLHPKQLVMVVEMSNDSALCLV